MTDIGSAATVLADIANVLESVDAPARQLERALVLLHRIVPYDHCALLDGCGADALGPPGATIGLVTVPPIERAEEGARLRARLDALCRLLADAPGQHRYASWPPADADRWQLAVPLLAVDTAVGSLLVERTASEYSEDHLKLLSVVAAALGGYLANARLQARVREATRAMRRAAELLERIRDGYVEIDGALRCVTANGAALELLGLAPDELRGADLRHVAGLAAHTALLEACARVLRERRASTLEATWHEPRARWLEIELYPTELGVALFLRDVTAQRGTEELRERMAAIIGHDLRTPLTAILTTSQLLLRSEGLSDRVSGGLVRIERSAERMREMVSELLDLTRIQLGGGLPIRREEVELGALCREVVNELAAANPGRQIDCACDAEVRGAWDAARLAQVLSNLLTNALQHGAAGAPVRVAYASHPDDTASIEVGNQGPPITPALQATIFEPFRRGEGRPRGGLGLGLFIAQTIVRAHGGSLSVSSVPGRETRFVVRLPLRG